MKVLFLTMGPPAEPPNWLRRKGGFCAAKVLRASKALFRKNSKTPPWNWLVPDLKTAVTTPPVDLPYWAVYSLVKTLNSLTASTPKLTFRPLPGLALAKSFTTSPSTRKTFPVGRLPEMERASPLPLAALEFEKLALDCCPIPPTTPACNVASCSQSRPLRGSSRTAVSPTSPPMAGLVVSTCGGTSLTSTCCCTSPTVSSKFTATDAPTVTEIPFRTEVLNPLMPASKIGRASCRE